MSTNCRIAPITRPVVSFLLALLLLGSPAPAAEPPALENLGFEAGPVGELPSGGWISPTEDWGYRVVTTDEDAAEGERSAVIVYEGAEPPAADAFGNLMRCFDASPYRGQRVRLSAMVRTRGQVFGDRAQLWLRVDRSGEREGFFDNMDDRPIVGSKWARYQIEGEVAKDAETVNLGAFLAEEGRAWIDDVRFEILGAIDLGHEPPRPLTDRGLANLEAFTRFLGYIRFFHPADGVAEVDWDALALAGVQAVEGAAGPKELAHALEESFRSVAPTVRAYSVAGPAPAMPRELLEPPAGGPERILAWRHTGVGLSTGSIYSSERIDLGAREEGESEGNAAKEEPPPVPADRVFEVDLGAGVAARVPMVLYADQDGTLPRAPQGARPPAPAKPEGFRPGGTDRTTRLAGVTLAWTVFQHFYPYFDVVEGDWDAELRRALRSAATDASLWDYQVTLRRLVAALGDGHGNVFHPETATPFELPVSWEWLERRLVVTGLAAEVPPGIGVGDVVLEVDGVPAGEALDRLAEETSASAPGFEAHRAASDLAARGGDEVVLRLESAGGETRVVTLPRRHSRSEPILSEPRPEPIVELEDGIEYVDLTRVSDEDLAESWDRLAAARGVVFDLRGYPAVGTATLSHLTDQPVSSAQWHVPAVTRPDRLEMAFEQSSWDLEPEAPRIRGKVAFLTDARAISYAETFLGIVEHYRLGEIVGSPTAGTNGNVNSIELPGGYRVRWTGMKVLKHDGSRHHGVGILPTVPASRTLQGIRAGRDEVLERGLEVVAGGG